MMNSEAITTRRYRPDDATATLEVFRRAVRTTAATDYSTEQLAAWAPDDLDPIEWAARREDARTWVALAAGAIVGFTDLNLQGHIGMLYVDPAVARRGVAAQLLALVLAVAEADGFKELTVDASHTARPFFEWHGFITERVQQVERRGVILTNCRMRRTL